jgi:hypothetical protein
MFIKMTSYKAKIKRREKKYYVIARQLRRMGFTRENIRALERDWDNLV